MRVVSFAKYLSLIVGAALLALAFYLYQGSNAFLESAVSAEGTVTELVRSRSEDSVSYRPVVEFTAPDGTRIEFVSSAGSNPPSYSRGERVEVMFDPENPGDARLDSFFSRWGAPLILAGLGSAFLLSGLLMFFVPGFKAAKNASLMKSGLRIDADIQGVERNTGLSVNGRHPWQITAQWLNPASMEVHIFKSQNLWFDPAPYLGRESVAVYLEPDDAKKYYMDVSFLPKLAS